MFIAGSDTSNTPHNREDIKETVQEMLMEALGSSVGIDGINSPMSYTFLAQEVDAQSALLPIRSAMTNNFTPPIVF